MDEQSRVARDFARSGISAAIRWAFLSASNRVSLDYSEAAGHDATWLGVNRYTYFRDRLDRVFSCERYEVPSGLSGSLGLDVVQAELTRRDIDTMPDVPAGLVRRANLNGSPGWCFDNWRWLLASCPVGGLDTVPWPRKSPTKQKVASQPTDASLQETLFDVLNDEEMGGIRALLEANRLDQETLIVAHAQDIDRDRRELSLGRARMNFGGGPAWEWRVDLLLEGPSDGSRLPADGPVLSDPSVDSTPDAPVRLRRPAADQPTEASG